MGGKKSKVKALSAEEIARLPYRRGVGMMLINAEGGVFAAQRKDTTQEAWQMPQGGIDKGESPREAAFRELEEEVGTRAAEIIGESRDWYRYDLPTDLVPRVWKGRFRGQSQKWFAMRFLGNDSDIDIATEHAEFTAWRWIALQDLPALIIPFKRSLYSDLVTEFEPLVAAETGLSEPRGQRR